MAYSWEIVWREWLAGQPCHLPRIAVVVGFQEVERALGADVVERYRRQGKNLTSGQIPTLSVVDLGQRLLMLENVPGRERLISKLKAGDSSAESELTALYLLRSGGQPLEVDLEPEVQVGDGIKRPDFRLRPGNNGGLYVEVTRPDVAEAEIELAARRKRFLSLMSIERSFAIEIYLRRDPSEEELQSLLGRARALCDREGSVLERIDTLGFIALNHTQPGVITPTILADEPPLPMISLVSGQYGATKPRMVMVRWAYSDTRAEKFFNREAKQLPKDAPGILMLDLTGVPGGPKAWAPLIKRRFQPKLNNRVSGVCMFHAGYELRSQWQTLVRRATLLVNPYATFPLPEWVSEALRQFPESRVATSITVPEDPMA